MNKKHFKVAIIPVVTIAHEEGELPKTTTFDIERRAVGNGLSNYYLTTNIGTKFSVIDSYELMKSAITDEVLNNMFKYWEAMLIDEDGSLVNGVFFRADSLQELCQKIYTDQTT